MSAASGFSSSVMIEKWWSPGRSSVSQGRPRLRHAAARSSVCQQRSYLSRIAAWTFWTISGGIVAIP